MEEIEYEKLRLDVLRKLIEERDISCKNSKDDMIKHLKMDDQEKYIRITTYEKEGKGYIIGIDIRNKPHLTEIHKLMEKKEAHNLNRYSNNRLEFWTTQKLI